MAVASPALSVLAGLGAARPWQEEFYRDLHQHPELSHQEQRPPRRSPSGCGQAGFEVHQGVGGTGVVGVLRNGDGPTVLLRADMDALPVREATGLPYASTVTATDADGNEVPVMHACGHDMHVTCLLGAAQLLAERPGALARHPGRAVPAGGGDRRRRPRHGRRRTSPKLIPAPDVALAQHVLPAPAGQVGTHAGPDAVGGGQHARSPCTAAAAHGSMPQATVDPVVLAAMIVVRLQTVVSREVPPTETAVLTVGSIQAGTKSNVIPDHAVLQLNVRTYSDADPHARCSTRSGASSPRSARPPAARGIRSSSCSTGSRSPTTTPRPPSGWPRPSPTSSATGPRPIGPADRQRGLQRHPHCSRRPLHLLVRRRHRRRRLPPRPSEAGRVAQDIPVNHSASFAPVIQPTLDTGTQALVVAALAWLAPLTASLPDGVRSGSRCRGGAGALRPKRTPSIRISEAERGRAERGRRGRRRRARDGGDRDARRRSARGWRTARCAAPMGTCRISTSRIVPPPTPVIAPRMTACAAPSPRPSALLAPVTANRLSPAASSTVIGIVSRSSRRLSTKATSPPPAATAR